MEFTPSQHEDEAAAAGDGVVTVLGRPIPLASGPDGSGLDAALDVLFDHPNVAPLVARHLITRLVTANPSPAYVARVARRFVDDGAGRRGQLAAVVRAVLLDDEARWTELAAQPTYGKAKEPVLGFTQLLRALRARPLDGWSGPTQPDKSRVPVRGVYWIPTFQAYGGQAPLRSASVFNFYSPDFVPSDPAFAAQGLVSPELQIQTDQMLVQYSNFLSSLLTTYEQNRIQRTQSVEAFAATRDSGSPLLLLLSYDDALVRMEQALEGDANGDFASINGTTRDAEGRTPKVRAVDALLEHLDAQLLGGAMTPAYRAALQHYLSDAVNASAADPRLEALTVVSTAYRLVATSALYMVQK